MIRDLAGFARAAGGTLQGGNAAFGPVASDSRTLEAGALFVALTGEHFDGHEFVAQAAARGAAGAVVAGIDAQGREVHITRDRRLAGSTRFITTA